MQKSQQAKSEGDRVIAKYQLESGETLRLTRTVKTNSKPKNEAQTRPRLSKAGSQPAIQTRSQNRTGSSARLKSQDASGRKPGRVESQVASSAKPSTGVDQGKRLQVGKDDATRNKKQLQGKSAAGDTKAKAVGKVVGEQEKSVKTRNENDQQKSANSRIGVDKNKSVGPQISNDKKKSSNVQVGNDKEKPSDSRADDKSKNSRVGSDTVTPATARAGSDKAQSPKSKTAESAGTLRDILNENERGELSLLIAKITKRMRNDTETCYDAAHVDEKKTKQQEKLLAKPEMQKLKQSNLQWFDHWRGLVILRIGEAVSSSEEASRQANNVPSTEDHHEPTDSHRLEALFPRTSTPLTKLSMSQRALILHAVLLLLLGLEHYNAASRVLLLYLTSSLKLGLSTLRDDEEQTAQGLLKAAQHMNADEETQRRLAETNNANRKWKIRLASAAGAAVIGYTGGLAAPMIAAGVGSVMGELGLGASAAASYLGAVAGSAPVVGSLFGAYGGRMTSQIMANLSSGVQDFAFLPLHGERKEHMDSEEAATTERRLRVVIGISGWLLEKEEIVTPWRVLKPSAEVFALRFDLEQLLNLGQSFDTMLQSAVYGYAQSAMVKQTIFAELMSGMLWPVALTKVARVVDNPFNQAKNRADKAGEVLADALINRVQGKRPVTLIGYSLGARVIWSCLSTLAQRQAFGLVESAVLIGAPVASDTSVWRSMRAVVSGRLVNVYSSNDLLLAFLYRASSLQYGVAGLVPIVGLANMENLDVTEDVSGHLRYRYLIGSILQKLRFEDVDKTEVAKEAAAFEAVVREEEKRTYLQQAGELFENYKGKKPQVRSRKRVMEISDADAESQISSMQKSVDEKTQSGLMQWAAEQLYLSPKSNTDEDKKSSKDDRSYYQWAKEATYLSRSGGKKGEEVAAQRKSSAKPEKPESSSKQGSGYLSGAAGYIPSGYVPSFSKSQNKANVPTAVSTEAATEEAKGYSSYLPSFGFKKSSQKATPAGESVDKSAGKTRDQSQDSVDQSADTKSDQAQESIDKTAGNSMAHRAEPVDKDITKHSTNPGIEPDEKSSNEKKPAGTPQQATNSDEEQTPHARVAETRASEERYDITPDTEAGTTTDEDPFTSPPKNGGGPLFASKT